MSIYYKTDNRWHVLVLVILISLCCFAGYYDHKRMLGNRIYNKKFVIVKISHEDGFTNDKFHSPTVYKMLLARYTEDTTKYIEWQVASAEQFYNYHLGDTLRFVFINKQRLFTIK